MTDRHTAYFVTLEEPIRDDDAESIVTALRQIKGVVDVRSVIADIDQMAAAIRLDGKWKRALLDLVSSGPSAD